MDRNPVTTPIPNTSNSANPEFMMLPSTVTIDLFDNPRDDIYLNHATRLLGDLSRGDKVPNS